MLKYEVGVRIEFPRKDEQVQVEIVERVSVGPRKSRELEKLTHESHVRGGARFSNSPYRKSTAVVTFSDGQKSPPVSVHVRPKNAFRGAVIDEDATEWGVIPK